MLDRKSELCDYFVKTLGKIPIRIGLLGLGRSNLALLRVLSEFDGLEITLRDSKEELPPIPLPFGGTLLTGRNHLSDISEEILFLSPSVRRDTPELKEAENRGVVLSSDADIFFSKRRASFTLAVTGSDGKSTVTELCSRLLNGGGISAPAIGNIGTPYISRSNAKAYVSELSSFNLEYLSPESDRAAITSISPNHLNWHKSYGEYINAKRNILKNTGGAVLSADDEESRRIASEIHSFAIFSATTDFSDLATLYSAEHYYTLSDGYILRDRDRVIPISSLQRKEDYNIKNMMCALALTDGLVPLFKAREILSSFTGLRHRCELIYSKGGIEIYNSSIDTSPTRSATTITSLGKNVRIILGGRGKGLSYDTLTIPLLTYAKKISVYGESKDEITEYIDKNKALSSIPHAQFYHFSDAVKYLLDDLKKGDVVLLSPACTAYGEFKDFEDRGNCFSRIISELFI